MELRPHLCAALATGGADEARLDRQPDVVGPTVGTDLDVVAATMVRQ